jgi:hypothetical protein
MNSPSRCYKQSPARSPDPSTSYSATQDPTRSPVFHSVFDLETVVLSPSSVSNLSQGSEVPTIVFGDVPIAEPVTPRRVYEGSPVVRTIKWYAIRKSIHGRTLIVSDWRDCEPNVKVWNVSKTEKIIPYGVEFHGFPTFEEAAKYLLE